MRAQDKDDDVSEDDRLPLWLAWLRLFRIPNVFTALADILMGFAIARGGFEPIAPLVVLLIASACLYSAGMILNDVFDIEQDTRERPTRPIPSGAISLGTARGVGFLLLAVGIVGGAVAGYLPQTITPAYPWRSGAMALAVAVSILLYDKQFKQTPIGPLFMALCRFFNVLLGASIAGAEFVEPQRVASLYFGNGELLAAAALATYVLGVTIFARKEATHSSKVPMLVAGLLLVVGGVALLYWMPDTLKEPKIHFGQAWIWPMLLAMFGVSVGRHFLTAVMEPQPRHIQTAVKFAILSIITFDALIVLHAAGANHALGVFLLMVPAFLLGKLVYST